MLRDMFSSQNSWSDFLLHGKLPALFAAASLGLTACQDKSTHFSIKYVDAPRQAAPPVLVSHEPRSEIVAVNGKGEFHLNWAIGPVYLIQIPRGFRAEFSVKGDRAEDEVSVYWGQADMIATEAISMDTPPVEVLVYKTCLKAASSAVRLNSSSSANLNTKLKVREIGKKGKPA